MILRRPFITDTEETFHIHCSGLLRDRSLCISRVVLGRCSCNGRSLGNDAVGED